MLFFTDAPAVIPSQGFENFEDFEDLATISNVSSIEPIAALQLLGLNPAQLNNLVLSYIEGIAAKDYVIEDGHIKSRSGFEQEIFYKKLSKKDQNPLFVFQAVCDAKDGNMGLAFINNLVQDFFEKHERKEAKLLLPMAQCRRSFLGIKKKHYVLVEITPGKIMLHDSKSYNFLMFFYPNCLKDTKLGKVISHNYGRQKDNISCGLFVYNYICSIIEKGSSDQLNKLPGVSLSEIRSNPTLLEDMLNENLSKTYKNFGKLDSGDPISWENNCFSGNVEEISNQGLNCENAGHKFISSVPKLEKGSCNKEMQTRKDLQATITKILTHLEKDKIFRKNNSEKIQIFNELAKNIVAGKSLKEIQKNLNQHDKRQILSQHRDPWGVFSFFKGKPHSLVAWEDLEKQLQEAFPTDVNATSSTAPPTMN